MDPSYAMAKFGLESKDMLKTKHKSCWYYTKYFFFFLSIIQFLIILGLVLFMLYGNAHVSTEVRLKNVEDRYKNLSVDYNWLNGNFSQLKGKLTGMEKENLNCSNMLTTALKQLYNRTSVIRPILPPMVPFPDVCKGYQIALDRCNTTYIIETLQLRHGQLILQRDYDRLKENCDLRNNTLTYKLSEATSEKEKYQNDMKDLQDQAKILQTTCTNINMRFETEIERMKNRFASIISSNEPMHYSKCWRIDGEIRNNIDEAINRMKQDVQTVMSENSQLKTEKNRLTDSSQKCSQDNKATIAANSILTKEKEELGKQLLEKKEELFKQASKYMKKEEELENCRRIQTGGRISNSFPRN